MDDTERVTRALKYLQKPRYDRILGYTVALQDLWNILNRENH